MAKSIISSTNKNPIVPTPSRSNHNRRYLAPKSMVVKMSTTTNYQSYWASINADVEAHLMRAVSMRPPHEVFRPMNHLTFSAPRTSAPGLCIAACELVDGDRDQALAAASALHVMHAAYCAHETLLHADEPRNGPISNHGYGPNIQLLTGDGLIPLGIEFLSVLHNPAQDNAGRVLRVIVEMSRAMGSQGMVEGLYNKSHYDQSNGEESIHLEYIDRVCKKKEGVLHACAGACGAILGGGSEVEAEKLRKFGLYVGTIQGLVHNLVAMKEKWFVQEVHKLRSLAIEELRGFNQQKVEAIASLVHTKLSNV